MIRINLLPYRAEKRRSRQIQYGILCGVSMLIGAAAVGTVYMLNEAQIAHQQKRNDYLKEETAALDRQIKEIEKLKEQTDALLARKNVVENLQSTRSDVVHLLDQVLRVLPEDMYLKTMKQTGNTINVTGMTQTNARVSTLIGAIRNSPWLENPNLAQISAGNSQGPANAGPRMSDFSMSFTLKKATEQPTSTTSASGVPASAPNANKGGTP